MTKHTIQFRDVYLDVEGNYSPYEMERDLPPLVHKFEIEKITLNDIDVTYLLDEVVEDIEQEILETHYR